MPKPLYVAGSIVHTIQDPLAQKKQTDLTLAIAPGTSEKDVRAVVLSNQSVRPRSTQCGQVAVERSKGMAGMTRIITAETLAELRKKAQE